jgi:heme oxygenase/predicted GNAT family N-acyltransferase
MNVLLTDRTASSRHTRPSHDIRTVVVQSEGERHRVYRLRYEVYIAEQGKAYVHADHQQGLLRDDADDYLGACLLVTVGGKPAATVRTTRLDDPRAFAAYRERFQLDHYGHVSRSMMIVCSRLAILPQYRRTRVVQAVFNAIYRWEAQRGVRLCFQYCSPALMTLFQHYGFVEYASPMPDAVLGNAHRMLLVVDDVKHLKTVGSPFYPIAVELNLRGADVDPLTKAIPEKSTVGEVNIPKQCFVAAVKEAITAFPTNRVCQLVDSGKIELRHYHAILCTIFPQTYFTPFTFARAAANCSWRHETAKDYLLRHAEEERTHWRWILSDLTTTGYEGPSVRHGIPHPTCQAYIGLNSFIADQVPVARLGISAVLEGIGAEYGGPYAKRLVRHLGLKADQTQFFLGHSETDKVHTAEIHKVIDQCELTPEEWMWMEHAARTAGQFYRAMYDHEAFV